MAEKFDLASAIIEIVGDPEKFEAALHKAETDGKGFVSKMGATFGVLAKIAIPAGIIATVGELAKKSLEAGEEINLMSKRTGVSTENLSRMAYAGAVVGVSLETIGSSMGRLARQMAKGEDEMGKQSKVLQRIGVSATDAKGHMRPLLDVMLDIQEKFKDMTPAQRLNAAFELFGRGGGQKMLDLLGMTREELTKLMKESDKFGYTMSTETAEQLEHYNQVLTRANLMVQGFSRTIVMDAIPAVEAFGGAFEDDFPSHVEGGGSRAGYYLKRFVIGVIGGFDLILAGVKSISIGIGYTIDYIQTVIPAAVEKIKLDVIGGFDLIGAALARILNSMRHLGGAVIDSLVNVYSTIKDLKNPLNPKNWEDNYNKILALGEKNLKVWKDHNEEATAENDEILAKSITTIGEKMIAQGKRVADLRNQINNGAAEDMETVYQHSLERIEKLWDEYFDHKAKKQEENDKDNGKRELTDAEKEAILAVKETIKQREIETATMKGQHRTAYELKLELIDLEKTKMALKGIPTAVIDTFAVTEAAKALAEFNKISEENKRLVSNEIADQQLATVTAAGLTVEVRRLTMAKIDLHAAELRQKGVTEELIQQWKELATTELDDRLTRGTEETLKAIAAMHREYEADILNTTRTQGEKDRLASKDKLNKRLDDLRTFGRQHEELWVEVLQLEKEAYSAYYEELSEQDRKYDTSWRSMFYRIEQEVKASSKRTADEMDGFAKNFVSSVGAFVGDEFFNTFTLNFDKAKESARSFFKDLLHQILNFLAQQAVMKFINLMVSKWGGTPAATGSSYASTWGSIGNGAVQASVAGHHAGGGMVWQRGIYELAEEGPEAVVPTRDGGHIPVKFEGGGKSNNAPIDIHQTVVITPDMFAAMRTSPDEVVTIVNSDYARNGQTRRTMRARR
jgi:hypothetical protein